MQCDFRCVSIACGGTNISNHSTASYKVRRIDETDLPQTERLRYRVRDLLSRVRTPPHKAIESVMLLPSDDNLCTKKLQWLYTFMRTGKQRSHSGTSTERECLNILCCTLTPICMLNRELPPSIFHEGHVCETPPPFLSSAFL